MPRGDFILTKIGLNPVGDGDPIILAEVQGNDARCQLGRNVVRSRVHTHNSWPNYYNSEFWSNQDLSESYHTYVFEWDNGRMRSTIDGHEIMSYGKEELEAMMGGTAVSSQEYNLVIKVGAGVDVLHDNHGSYPEAGDCGVPWTFKTNLSKLMAQTHFTRAVTQWLPTWDTVDS